MQDIRENLKTAIDERGYKQTTIAERVKLTPAKLSGILNKSRKLDANELFLLCDVLGLTPGQLRNYTPTSRIYEEETTVRVCITYRMTKKQWDTAENCLVNSISKAAYREITEELKVNCWSMAMECEAGQRVATMLTALARLQGYSKVDSWSIELAS